METNDSRSHDFGISITRATGSGAAQRFGVNSTDVISMITGQVTHLGGLFAGGSAGRTIEIPTASGGTTQVGSVNALIKAIAADSSTNVLATPQLLAQDNTEAIFEVGEQIPVPEQTNSANGSSTFTTKQQTVALTLKFTPQINKVTRFVKLKIDQQIEDFSERKLPQALQDKGIAITTRKAVTTVVVRDQDTVAMGGLMRDKVIETESKVPLLGDIPLLGWLFKNKSKSVTKVNLLFFLTPRIMSPYKDTMAGNLRDRLDARYKHLRPSFDAPEMPFKEASNDIYQKAIQQEQGFLYDPRHSLKYQIENQNGDKSSEDEESPFIMPIDETQEAFMDNKLIEQTIKRKHSGRDKR